MATHSSVLAWRIPGMAEPGGLPTMGSHRVGHNWSDLAAPGLLLVKHQLINIWLYLAKNISIHLFFLYTSINKLWCILELTLNLISKHFSIYIYLTSLSTLLRGASPKKKKRGASQVVLMVKNMLPNAGNIRDVGLIPGSGRSPGGGHGNPLQYSCLENPIDRGV